MSKQMSPPKAYFDRKPSLDGPQYEEISQIVGLTNYSEKSNYQDLERARKFNATRSWNDLWALVLFMIHLGSYIGILIYTLKLTNLAAFKTGQTVLIHKDILIGMSISGITAVFASILYITMIRFLPGLLIQLSFIFICLASIGTIGAAAYFGQYYVCAGAGFVLIIDLLCWFFWRNRIELTKQILKVVAKFTGKYPSTVLIGLLFLVFQLAYFASFIILTFSLINYNSTCDDSKGIAAVKCIFKAPGYMWGIFVFALFSVCWTLQVLKDIVHLTVAGTFGFDYFSQQSSWATLSSLGRAVTTSFGSICFGSMLISIIKFIKAIVHIFTSNTNGCLSFIGCCIGCCLSCIEGIIEFFNSFAYTYCAIYGTSFIEGGKATMTLIKSRGVDAIINDSLISNVLSLGSFIVGLISIGFTYLYIHFGTRNVDDGEYVVVVGTMFAAFFMAISVFIVFGEIIEAASSAFFVCLAEEPEVLKNNNQKVYNKILAVYPSILSPA
ncbi:DUF580-domain-containing protein [Neoconidiobolus thromboides FSU 785]|nr:DUF580-domain-containing protein [Neoconidiobolus thromboides FSU 785]